MKRLPAFLFLAGAAFAQTFVTGQAARAVIGQSTFTQADPNSSNTVIGAVGGIAYAANTLFVADDNRMGAEPENNRVLLYQNISSMLPAATADLTYDSKCPVCVGQASVVLGQQDFVTDTTYLTATQSNLRQPTALASDGVHLVVADTNHNRVLIWNHIPTQNNEPADVVVGQPNFAGLSVPPSASASSLRGPQGVWIQDGRLYVADTQNNRVLIWNHLPTQNGASADVVLGQPNFTAFVETDLTQQSTSATASNMINPVSVTSDGTRLFVTDLGYNRVLIWNNIPTANGAPADVEIGQPDMNSSVADNAFTGTAASDTTDTTDKETPVLCTVSNGTDPNGNPTYPSVCNYTLNFPRFALSDGQHLFIADGGNDRVLEYYNIPTANAAAADVILGQIGGAVDQATDAVDSMNTPSSLAWDGSNLYVADPYNRRITVFTVASNVLAYQAVVNSANPNIYSSGTVTIGGGVTNGNVITVTIAANFGTTGVNYTYKAQATDAIEDVLNGVANSINAGNGDPNVKATVDVPGSDVTLTARLPGPQGDNIAYSTTVSSGSTLTSTAKQSTLTGGGSAAQVAPGTLVSVNGNNLSPQTASADLAKTQLPTDLAGTEVFVNGIKVPLLMVSPSQINAQVPWEFTDTTSVNVYVRSVQSDGSIMVTSPVALTIVPANPGLFTIPNTGPPVNPVATAVATHGSSYAMGLVSVDGSVNAGDVATVNIADRAYNYTVQSSDTLDTIRDNLVVAINADPQVIAQAAGVFDRIILQARVQGPDGDNITFGASANAGASVVMTPFGTQLCCANIAGAPLTQDNPAVAGEVINVYATGLGLPVLTDSNSGLIVTGQQYPVGGPETSPVSAQFVSSLVGGTTADVLNATLTPGTVGQYQVVLHLNSCLAANTGAELTIAQSAYVSNVAAIPVVSQPTCSQ